MTWLLALLLVNLLVSVASVLAAAIAVVRPSALSHSTEITPAERFYAQMYAARSVPLGLLAGVLPLFHKGLAPIVILLTAGVVQATDVAIALARRDWQMVRGALVGTIVPAGVCYVLLQAAA